MAHAVERSRVTVRALTSVDTHPLRMRVLRPGRPEHESVYPGDDDRLTLHAGALLDGAVVAVASIYREARPADGPGQAPRQADHDAGTAWRLRGVATDPDARRRGAGAAALAACEVHARDHGGTLAWCNARADARAFYEANGWTVLGKRFDTPTGGPHFVMEKRLGDRVGSR